MDETDEKRQELSPEIINDESGATGEPAPANEVENGEEVGPFGEIVVIDVDSPELDMNYQRIGAITAGELEKMRCLERLYLRWNLIKKIENLESFTSLVELELYGNQITEIVGLNTLVNLEILDLSFNRITEIKGLENLLKLKKLYLSSNKISKIENLSHLTDLELLELGNNKIRVIENLDTLVNLESLFLGKNKITEINNLSSLKNLKLLSLQVYRRAGNNELFRFVPHREHAQVDGRDEAVLEAVAQDPTTSTRRLGLALGMPHSTVHNVLRAQSLYPYHLSKVQELLSRDAPQRVQFCEWYRAEFPLRRDRVMWTDEATFTRAGIFNLRNSHVWAEENPREVYVSHHQYDIRVNVWAGMTRNGIFGPVLLPNRLNGDAFCNCTRLTTIKNLEELTELTDLYLSENGIETVEGLEHNTKLTTLDLAMNKITKIENISHLTQLEELWMNHNKVADWNCVNSLSANTKLQTIYLEKNPINEDANYRRKIKLAVPWITQIDATLAR